MTVKMLLDILSALPEDCEDWPVSMSSVMGGLHIGAVAIIPGPDPWPSAGTIRLTERWPEAELPARLCECDDREREGS